MIKKVTEAFTEDATACFTKVVFSSRWLLAPLYLGLSSVLVLFLFKFFRKLFGLFCDLPALSDKELTLGVLHLVDIVMLANLTIMILIGSYTLFIRRVTVRDKRDKLSWLDEIDAGALKVKLGMALIGVSSVHLLEAFIEADALTMEVFIKQISIHMVFVISTVGIAWIGTFGHGHHSNVLEEKDDHSK